MSLSRTPTCQRRRDENNALSRRTAASIGELATSSRPPQLPVPDDGGVVRDRFWNGFVHTRLRTLDGASGHGPHATAAFGVDFAFCGGCVCKGAKRCWSQAPLIKEVSHLSRAVFRVGRVRSRRHGYGERRMVSCAWRRRKNNGILEEGSYGPAQIGRRTNDRLTDPLTVFAPVHGLSPLGGCRRRERGSGRPENDCYR